MDPFVHVIQLRAPYTLSAFFLPPCDVKANNFCKYAPNDSKSGQDFSYRYNAAL